MNFIPLLSICYSGLDMDDMEDPCTPPGVCLDSSSTEDIPISVGKTSNNHQMHTGINGDLSFRTASNPDLNVSASGSQVMFTLGMMRIDGVGGCVKGLCVGVYLVMCGCVSGHVWGCTWSCVGVYLVMCGCVPGHVWGCTWSCVDVYLAMCGGVPGHMYVSESLSTGFHYIHQGF